MSHLVVCDVSMRTPVGFTAAATAAAIRAGISRLREHPRFVSPGGEMVRGAHDDAIVDELSGWKRMQALAEPALQVLTSKWAWLAQDGVRCQLLLGVPEHRPGFSADDEQSLVAALRRAVPAWTVSVAGHGHAGALHAFEHASALVRQGLAHACVVGGVDSYFHGETLDWLVRDRRLQADGVRSGFFPGEASGFVLLTDDATRIRAGLPKLATVTGFSSAQETNTLHTDEVNLARALTEVIREAVASLRQRGRRCDTIFCDLNGERYRTDEWSTAQLRLETAFGYAPGQPVAFVTATRSCGDVGAATGPLLVALATEAWRRGYGGGAAALLFCGSDAGLRSAVVLEQEGAPSCPASA